MSLAGDSVYKKVKKLGPRSCIVRSKTLGASTEELDVEDEDFFLKNAYSLAAHFDEANLQLVISGRFATVRKLPRKATANDLVALTRTAAARL